MFRVSGDNGISRRLSTPNPEILMDNANKFITKWKSIKHDGVVILTDNVEKEINKLKVHMNKGCLSNIGTGCGTNRNEALHRHINAFFNRSRISVLLAYALISVFLYSHNSTVNQQSKKLIKPIQSCIALQQKLTCTIFPKEAVIKDISEHIGIKPAYHQLDDIVYDQSLEGESVDHIFDCETSSHILLQAVQQAMVLKSIKAMRNQVSEQISMYSLLSSSFITFLNTKKTLCTQDHQLDNILETNDLQRVIIPGDGNCCFYSVACSLKDATKGKNPDHPLLTHLQAMGLNWLGTYKELASKLRELTVNEWRCNELYYTNFLDKSSSFEDEVTRFIDERYFEGSLGDTMILAMSNVICTPIIIFSSMANQPIIPVMPRTVVSDELISVAYNHIGSGHYDSVKPITLPKKSLEDIHCRCGVNGDQVSCVDHEHYQSRCKCYKMKHGCTKACKCKNCSNSFGKRPVLGKRKRENHSNQMPLPSSKQFINERSEKLAHGPWTSLENSIFLLLVEHFDQHSEELSAELMLKGYKEIILLSNSPYNYINIPDSIIKPGKKSLEQIKSKLEHYFKTKKISEEVQYMEESNTNTC